MKKRPSAEQIVLLLREADVELGKGEKVPEVYRKLGITQKTYYRWRTKYGSMESVIQTKFGCLARKFLWLARVGRKLAESPRFAGFPP